MARCHDRALQYPYPQSGSVQLTFHLSVQASRFGTRVQNEMTDEIQLRQLARHAISDGKLPSTRPERVWGGPGSGACCAVCGKPVTSEQTGFELEFTPAATPDSAPSHTVHIRCLAAWELERSASGQPDQANAGANGHFNESPPGENLHSSGVLPGAAEGGTMTGSERPTGHRRGPE